MAIREMEVPDPIVLLPEALLSRDFVLGGEYAWHPSDVEEACVLVGGPRNRGLAGRANAAFLGAAGQPPPGG
jgi:hypothetical protein